MKFPNSLLDGMLNGTVAVMPKSHGDTLASDIIDYLTPSHGIRAFGCLCLATKLKAGTCSWLRPVKRRVLNAVQRPFGYRVAENTELMF